MLTITDLFAGAGGSSSGAERVPGVWVVSNRISKADSSPRKNCAVYSEFEPISAIMRGGSGGATNTLRSLTRSSDLSREGLAVEPTRTCPPLGNVPTIPPEPAGEEWRPVSRAPGYLVSNLGRVIGIRGHVLRGDTVKGGYHRVGLFGRNHLVHVIVAEAFLGPKPDGFQVNHKDGDKDNNAAMNLEYVSPRENVRHSLDVLGVRRARGSRNGQARLTENDVREIRRLFAVGHTKAALARRLGVCDTTVGRAISGERWSHVKDSDVDGD